MWTQWHALALSPYVIRRGLLFAVIVGGVLVAINHGDAIFRGDLDMTRVFRILLTLITPYIVSTISSVSAMRENSRQNSED